MMNKRDCDFLAEVLKNLREIDTVDVFGVTAADRAIREIADYVEGKLGVGVAHDFYKACGLWGGK